MSLNVSAFKAYDLRGRIPDQLNEEIAFAVGRACAEYLQPQRLVVGHDIRLSSPAMTEALVQGLTASGVDVAQLGICGTEEVYFACDHYGFDGGVAVTASHNPKDYNGMKLVRRHAQPISADSGLNDIRDLVAANKFADAGTKGEVSLLDHQQDYIDRLLTGIDVDSLRPLKIVFNPGNGGAGKVMEQLKPLLPMEFIGMQEEPDGNFPNGVPNPLLPENRAATSNAVVEMGADLGIAWDGDFDRCFFFDENGRFIEGYYLVGLLAGAFLGKSPGGKIVHDARLIWNTIEVVRAQGGIPVQSKGGHAFMKETMRRENAIYGGEMSAHHFFADFAFCDSGMLPWLHLVALMSKSGASLAELVDDRIARYPVSGEINRKIDDLSRLFKEIERKYAGEAEQIEHLDGLSMTFANWRFNLRSSNTEPVVRLNVESRGDHALMQEKTEALLNLMA